MSRIYQPNKVNAPIVKQNSSAAYEASSVITPNRVASNVKLFTNNINNNSSNNSSRSSSPRVSSFASSSMSKQFGNLF